jgi:hypothetical protein
MKQWLDWMRDPSFHLIALTTALAAFALAHNSRSWWTSLDSGEGHPSGCHACSLCPPQAAEARDAYLIRTGGIAPLDGSE